MVSPNTAVARSPRKRRSSEVRPRTVAHEISDLALAVLTARLQRDFDELVVACALSRREVDVLLAFFHSQELETLADTLRLGCRSVERHIESILHKTEAPSLESLLIDLLISGWGLDASPMALSSPVR